MPPLGRLPSRLRSLLLGRSTRLPSRPPGPRSTRVPFRPLALAPISLLAALALLAAGCGDKQPSTPDACFGGPAAYLKALAAAPGEVRIGGEAELGECLVERQDAGELSQVGEAMIAAATQLNAEARDAGGGRAATELGYLVGTAERRAEQTDGVHSELVRRLAVAARFAPGGKPLGAEFLKNYQAGFDAARGS